MRVTVLNGVNLGMLGIREPDVYGTLTHAELTQRIQAWAGERGQRAEVRQTDSEGEYVQAIHAACGEADAVIVNPGAWTHYSWAIRDALAILPVPVVEVHLSEPLEREPWRHLSVVSEVAAGAAASEMSENSAGSAPSALMSEPPNIV